MNGEAKAQVVARRYGANRQAAVWASAVFLALGSAVVLLSYWALDPSRRLGYLRESAIEFIAREEWRQAALQLGNIVQVAPSDSDAWRELGLVQLREASGENSEQFLHDAVRSLRKAADLAPDDARPCRWLLEVELRTGNAEQARDHARKLAELDPKHPLLSAAWDALPSAEVETAAALEASLDTVRGAETTAETCRERFASSNDRDPELVRVFVKTLTKLQRYAERERFLNDLTNRYHASKRLQCLRAECALLDGDVGGAVATASKCVDGPTAATARAICAEAHLRWAAAEPAEAPHHFGQALEHLQVLAELSPGDDAVVANMALVAGERLGRLDAALQATQAALARSTTQSAELLEVHGRLLTAGGRADEALEYLERANTAAPSRRTWASLSTAVRAAKTNPHRRDGKSPGESVSSN